MGLLRMAARTAVVAGTATAVSGRVGRRQANRFAQKDDAQAQQQQDAAEDQAAPEQNPTPPADAPEQPPRTDLSATNFNNSQR